MSVFGLDPVPPGQEGAPMYLQSWLVRTLQKISSLTAYDWPLINFTGSNITDIVNKDHNDLDNKQGGTTNEYYHLTSAQETKLNGIETGAEVNNISDTNATDLTDTGDTTLHYHSADRDRSNHTGTQTLSTISDAGTAAGESGLSVTITLAKITAGGTDGSVTFTNGVLTAKVDPT